MKKRFNKNVEVEEVKQTLTGREKAEIRAKIKENEKKIEQLKRENRETERQMKAKIKQATSQVEQNRKAREKEQKLFDLIDRKIDKKLSGKKDLTAEEIKILFWYCVYNNNMQSRYIEFLTQALENIAFGRIPEINKSFEIIDKRQKEMQNNLNVLINKVSYIEKLVLNKCFTKFDK